MNNIMWRRSAAVSSSLLSPLSTLSITKSLAFHSSQSYFSTPINHRHIASTTRSFTSTTPAATATSAADAQVGTQLRFRVMRTASRQLPVYTEYKRQKGEVFTIVRKIEGDYEQLRDELQVLAGREHRVQLHQGFLKVKGNHVQKFKARLAEFGF